MGVNALTYGTLWCLDLVADQLGERFHYTILGQGAKDKDGCIDEIEINQRKISFRFRHLELPKVQVRRLRGWWQFLRWLMDHAPEFIENLSQYDLILDIGEGDSFTDIYGGKRFVRLCLTKALALYARRPLVLLPQTIGPFEHTFSRFVARQLMRRIQYIYPRDQTSLEYLRHMFPHREFRQYLDLAFHLPYDSVHFAPGKTHVGLNISALLWHGGYTQDNMFNLALNYRQLMEEVIQFFLEQKDVLVHLVPHVVLAGDFVVGDDYAIAEQIHRDMPQTILSPAFNTPIEAKSYISGLDFLVGARMHACIAAYSSSVPMVPLAYSRKFSGLFTVSLNYPILVDLKSDSQTQASQKVREGFERREVLRQAILAKKETLEADLDAFRQELANIIEEIHEA
jgi:polysaccharide pyruvyl transferase WcaK-like protein